MGMKRDRCIHLFIIIASICFQQSYTVTIKDIFTNDTPLTRLPRDSKYANRFDSRTDNTEKTLKPEETSEDTTAQSLGKRCVRCENGYLDRNPYDRNRNYYEDRLRDYDRYDDRYYERDRYYDRDRYGDRYDRYERYRYPNSQNRYDRYDRYTDRDRYDRYDRDRYNDYDRYEPYDRSYDRYDRYERYPDRGIGYDNRGYDYRQNEGYRDSYRPYDETYRGTSGFDSSGKGYYYAAGRPEYSREGIYGNGRYASGWSSGGGRDDYTRDRDYYGGRPYRDPYDSGYRTTSYLYGRPSSTTIKPSNSDDSANTQSSSINS